MTLQDFAEMAGVSVFRCEREWGGTWAYRTPDAPNCSMCGYRSERELYKAWAEDSFGKQATKALIALLRARRQRRKRKNGKAGEKR